MTSRGSNPCELLRSGTRLLQMKKVQSTTAIATCRKIQIQICCEKYDIIVLNFQQSCISETKADELGALRGLATLNVALCSFLNISLKHQTDLGTRRSADLPQQI